tara:strand:+ start:265 stop:495 length:231 start_codon:yes stop_codon:yes gene_type:complete
MEYTITLNEEQLMSLIEIVESHRCEGEDELLSEIRTSMKAQFKKQFFANQDVDTSEEDVVESAKKAVGPGYCDNCD